MNRYHNSSLAMGLVTLWLAIGFAPVIPSARAADNSPVFPAVNDLPVQTNLPDPLVLADGQKITTPEQWNQHREQMRAIIEHYAVGHAPPPPGNVTGQELDTQMVLDGKAVFHLIHLSFGPEHKLGFDAALFIPLEAGAHQISSFPTIVQPSFSFTPGVSFTPITNAVNHKVAYPVTAEEGATNYTEVLARGYAVMTFYYQECGADGTNFAQTGFFPAYPGYDWRDLRAWAWGMSRCVDYLEQQPFVDKTQIIAVGHSRLGKATLVAGAFDDRFALVAPAGSGCGGTGAYRFNGKTRGGKEGLEDVEKHFPQWLLPQLGEFSGQVEKLPFDQNWLIALVAPRVFIATDGLNDAAANENALAQAWLGAKPVYDLLGVPDHLGIHFRPGKHMLAPADWKAILDFSDQQLRGLKVDERFDQLPPLDQLH
jgi:hypothetical protein